MSFKKENIVDIELTGGNIHRSFLNHAIGRNDDDADWFGVRVFRDGSPVNLEGGSVQGFFKQPGRDPIAITSGNRISGNLAEVLLPQACYNYDGQFTLAIKLISTSEGVTGTMRIVDGIVENTNVNGAVAPTGTIPTYQEILAVFEQMVAAKEGSVRFDITQELTDAQSLKARNNISSASQADMDTVNGKIGNTPLPTTAQTLTGAIAEHETDIQTEITNRTNADNDLRSALDAIREHTKNLVEPDNVLNAYFTGSSTYVKSNDGCALVFIPCEASTTYTVSKKAGTRFAVGYTKTYPVAGENSSTGTAIYGIQVSNTAASITITTGSDAEYLVAWVFNGSSDTVTRERMLASVQIEIGSSATSYENPYSAIDRTLREEIGDTALPTTAQTLTGAIAEHETDIDSINGAIAEHETDIDSINSKIGTVPSGETVQGQIDTLESDKVPKTRKVNGHALSSDVTVTKGDVGLGNVDNTSDEDKPISTAQAEVNAQVSGLLGNTELPTTAQTVTGAIAEHETDIQTEITNRTNADDELKKALQDETGVKTADFISGYYETGEIGTVAAYTQYDGMVCAILPCKEHDVVTVTLSGASSARAWAYLDNSYKILDRASSNAVMDDHVISSPPADTAYVVFNNRISESGTNPYRPTGYYAHVGKYPADSISSALVGVDGTEIKEGDDIDTYLTAGTYYVKDASASNEIDNLPIQGCAGRLFVVKVANFAQRVKQFYFHNSTQDHVFTRYYNGSSFTKWSKLITDSNSVTFQRILTSSDDLDDVYIPGMYSVTNDGTETWKPNNWPLTGGGNLIVTGSGTTSRVRKTQMIYTHLGYMIFRVGIGSTSWSDWSKLSDNSGEVQAQTVGIGAEGLIASLAERISILEQANNIDAVPSYYESMMESKASAINTLAPTKGKQFVFITDTHVKGYANQGGNARHSHSLINYLCRNTLIDTVVNGGDIITGRTDGSAYDIPSIGTIGSIREGIRYSQPDSTAMHLFVGGNHDLGASSEQAANITAKMLAKQANLYSPSPYGVVYDKVTPFQYYLDDDVNKVRMIVLCMGMNGSSGLSGHTWWDDDEIAFTSAIPFYLSALKNTPENYNIVVINHISGIPTSSATGGFEAITSSNYINYLYKPFVAYQQKTTWSYNGLSEDFSSVSGIAACMIFGHSHRDVTGESSDILESGVSIGGTIPLFLTTTDNAGGNLDQNVTREIGTASEQAFDVFTVDTTNRKIYVTRIGGGSDRTNSGNGYSY